MLGEINNILYENNILEKESEKVLILQPQVCNNGEINYFLNTSIFDKLSRNFDNNIIDNYMYIDNIIIENFGIDCLNVRSKEEFLIKKDLHDNINGVWLRTPTINIDSDINNKSVSIEIKDRQEIYRDRYYDVEVCDHWNAIMIVDIIGIKSNNENITSSIMYLLESIDRIEKDDFIIAFQKIYHAVEIYIRVWKDISYLEPKQVKKILKDEGFDIDAAVKIQKFRNNTIHPKEYEFFTALGEDETKIMLDAYKYLIDKYGIK